MIKNVLELQEALGIDFVKLGVVKAKKIDEKYKTFFTTILIDIYNMCNYEEEYVLECYNFYKSRYGYKSSVDDFRKECIDSCEDYKWLGKDFLSLDEMDIFNYFIKSISSKIICVLRYLNTGVIYTPENIIRELEDNKKHTDLIERINQLERENRELKNRIIDFEKKQIEISEKEMEISKKEMEIDKNVKKYKEKIEMITFQLNSMI